MKRLFACILSMLMVIGLCLPVAAQEKKDIKRVTMRAHVLSNRADMLIVHLAAPEKLRQSKIDEVADALELPVTADTAYLDRDGKALAADAILPGQEIAVTFQYTYEPVMYDDGTTTGYSYVEPVRCIQARLSEKVVPVSSRIDPADLKPETGIGVILSIALDEDKQYYKICHYVEAAYTTQLYTFWYGADLRRHDVDAPAWRRLQGTHNSILPKDAVIYDTKGWRIRPEDLQPNQRIYLEGSLEYDPFTFIQFEKITKARVLSPGEKIMAPQDLTDRNLVRCTVLENRAGEELLVRADPDSWVGRQQETWTVPLQFNVFESADDTPRFSCQPGDVVTVPFRQVCNEVTPGVLTMDIFDEVKPAA